MIIDIGKNNNLILSFFMWSTFALAKKNGHVAPK
jgi:hypothetical protein